MANFDGFIFDAPPLPFGNPGKNFSGFLTSAGVAPVQFAQRVWSTGTLVWCYYIDAINPTPASTATTPNWSGSAVRHEVLGAT